jgi:hypothetical protein
MAYFGKEGGSESVVPKLSQETLAEMVGTTRSRVSFFMNRFRKLGFTTTLWAISCTYTARCLSLVLDDDVLHDDNGTSLIPESNNDADREIKAVTRAAKQLAANRPFPSLERLWSSDSAWTLASVAIHRSWRRTSAILQNNRFRLGIAALHRIEQSSPVGCVLGSLKIHWSASDFFG